MSAFQHRIAFNCIPHIDKFLDDDSTKEEWKMVAETKKIMGDAGVKVAATWCSRSRAALPWRVRERGVRR